MENTKMRTDRAAFGWHFVGSVLTAILCVCGVKLLLEEKETQILHLAALGHEGIKRWVRTL